MASKTYSVRVPQGVEIDSDNLAAWLDSIIEAGGGSLAPDPGPGQKTLRVSLDSEKVEQTAKLASESESVFLRRLIATRVRIPEEEKEREKPRPKSPVLPKDLRISAEQLEPAIAGVDALQSWLLSRYVVRVPETREASRMTANERADLSRSSAQLINRRAPAWLAENIDVLGFALQIASIESGVISRVYEAAEARRKQQPEQQRRPSTVPFPDGTGIPGGGVDAE